MKILIKVTKEVKMCGFDGSFKSSNCAIAYAVRCLFEKAAIGAKYIYFKDKFNTKRKLPSIAIKFITQFDDLTPNQRVKMTPISFEIDVPDSVIESIGISQVYKILSESKTLEHVN